MYLESAETEGRPTRLYLDTGETGYSMVVSDKYKVQVLYVHDLHRHLHNHPPTRTTQQYRNPDTQFWQHQGFGGHLTALCKLNTFLIPYVKQFQKKQV